MQPAEDEVSHYAQPDDGIVAETLPSLMGSNNDHLSANGRRILAILHETGHATGWIPRGHGWPETDRFDFDRQILQACFGINVDVPTPAATSANDAANLDTSVPTAALGPGIVDVNATLVGTQYRNLSAPEDRGAIGRPSPGDGEGDPGCVPRMPCQVR